ncbi:hypothetical protein BC828DRAFT_85057 [Blastocladiella britannica]|nr:hypothetical protein BC828DRAFT_85057 [Blastocladiella britannica]
MDLDEMTALAATTEQQHPTSPSDQPVPHAPVARHVTTALAADHPEPLSGQSHNPTRRATKRRRLDDTGSLAGAVASLVVECEAVQEKDLKHQGEIQRLQGDLAVAVGDLSRERDASQQLKDRVTELGCRVAETSAQLSKTQAALDESIKFATAERRTLDHEREAREAAQKELSLLNIQLEHASANVSVGSQVAELSSAVTEKLSKLSLACASIDDALGGNHTAIEELATKRLDVPTSQLFARIGTCQETVTAQLGGLDAKVASCLLDKLKPLYVTELNRTVAKIRSDTLADSERALSSLTNDMRAKFHVMEDVASVREQLAVALAQSASMSAQREKETKDHQQLVSELAVEREKCVRLEGELASVRQERLTLQVCARSLEGQLKNTDASCMGLEHQLQAARHELATVRERTESLGEQLRDAVQARERAEADQVLGRKDLSATKEEALSLQFKLASETRARADAEATARRQLEEQVTLMTEKTNKLAIAEHSAQSATDRLNAITDQMAATQAQLDAAEAARIHLEEKLHMATEQAAAQVAETRRIEQHWTEQLRECNREWQTRLQQALSSAKNERELMSEVRSIFLLFLAVATANCSCGTDGGDPGQDQVAARPAGGDPGPRHHCDRGRTSGGRFDRKSDRGSHFVRRERPPAAAWATPCFGTYRIVILPH